VSAVRSSQFSSRHRLVPAQIEIDWQLLCGCSGDPPEEQTLSESKLLLAQLEENNREGDYDWSAHEIVI